MTRLLELLTSVVIVIALFILVGVFLPNQREIKQSDETNHPIRQVYDTLNSFKRFGDWNPLRQHDPDVEYTTSGADRGVGAQLDYVSAVPSIGSGSWHITESKKDKQIRYAVYNDARGQNKSHNVTLDQQGKLVEINWTYSVDYGWDLLGRYAGIYVDRNVGDDVKRSLANITNLLASMPNFDYSTRDVKVEEIASQNMLFISTSSDRNITAVENAMDLALKDIRTAIASNKLIEAGRPRLITTNFGAEKYEFDIAVPVALPEADTALSEQEATEETASEEAVAVVDEAAEAVLVPLEGLTLPENIKVGQSYGGKVVMTAYRGHPAALPLVRDELRSYAAAFGETLHDRAFEEYLTEITETAADDAQFKVYWPIQ